MRKPSGRNLATFLVLVAPSDRRRLRWPRMLWLAVALVPAPGLACSGRFTGPRNPEQRYAGTEVRRVVGTYRLERVAVAGGYVRPALFDGRITTRRGSTLLVRQAYMQPQVDCGFYDLPLGDAQGTFYLSPTRRGGRYELLGWTGTLIPGNRIPQPGEEGNK
jgi:hypothetical protein